MEEEFKNGEEDETIDFSQITPEIIFESFSNPNSGFHYNRSRNNQNC